MVESPDPAVLAALLSAQDVARDQLNSQAGSLVQQAVVAFTGWYDTEAVAAWTGQVAELVNEVMRSLAYTVDAYLATITSQLTGRWVRPTGSASNAVLLRANITPEGVYGRVADAYRWQQAQLDQAARGLLTGATSSPPELVSPIHAALDRAEQVTDLNTQLVVRNQSRASLQAQHEQGLITGWRRVPHPELSTGGTCGLCWAASTRIYHTGELMPIHHSCHCLPMPVTAEHDIGSVINDSDFAQLYGEAGGTDAAALKRTRYQVTEHGELGPLLAKPGKVRTVRQAQADENKPPRRPNTPEQNLRHLTSLRNGLAPALTKLDQLVADDPSWEPFRRTVADRLTDLEHQLAA